MFCFNSPRRPRRSPSFFRPTLELLECRLALSTLTVTSAADSGTGSLRAEVAAAASGDTIVFAPNLAGQTISLNSTIDINNNVTIQGLGASQLAISGNNAHRVFDIGSGFVVEIDGLTIESGKAAGNGTAGSNRGGGIYSSAHQLTLYECVVKNNEAVGTAVSNNTTNAGQGGGLYSATGFAILSYDTFSGNRAEGGAGNNGGVDAAGYNGGNGQGGGVFLAGGGADIQQSTFSTNQAVGGNGGNGQGGSSYPIGGAGGNGGDGQGGALFVATAAQGVNPQDSTFADNVASGGNGGNGADATAKGGAGGNGGNGQGGGVYVVSGAQSFTNVTLADNSTQAGAGGTGGSSASDGAHGNAGTTTAGGIYNGGGTLDMLDDLIAANRAALAPDVFGTFVSTAGVTGYGGYNFIGDGNGSTGFSAATGDQVGTSSHPLDPLLGPLQNNGGLTQTMALLAGSPAIDAGSSLVGNQFSPGPFDQRGNPFARVINGRVDDGAYEYQPPATQTTLQASAATATNTQVLTLTATVQPLATSFIAPAGTVTFFDGGTVLATATLVPVVVPEDGDTRPVEDDNDANASSSVSISVILPLGVHNLTARYNPGPQVGDVFFDPSSSAAPLTVVVTPPAVPSPLSLALPYANAALGNQVSQALAWQSTLENSTGYNLLLNALVQTASTASAENAVASAVLLQEEAHLAWDLTLFASYPQLFPTNGIWTFALSADLVQTSEAIAVNPVLTTPAGQVEGALALTFDLSFFLGQEKTSPAQLSALASILPPPFLPS
jgi:hypothetical protein